MGKLGMSRVKRIAVVGVFILSVKDKHSCLHWVTVLSTS